MEEVETLANPQGSEQQHKKRAHGLCRAGESKTSPAVNILPQQSHTSHHHPSPSAQGLATVLLHIASAVPQETDMGA